MSLFSVIESYHDKQKWNSRQSCLPLYSLRRKYRDLKSTCIFFSFHVTSHHGHAVTGSLQPSKTFKSWNSRITNTVNKTVSYFEVYSQLLHSFELCLHSSIDPQASFKPLPSRVYSSPHLCQREQLPQLPMRNPTKCLTELNYIWSM